MKVKKRSVLLFVSFSALIMVYFTNCAGELEMSNSLNTLCISQDCYSANKAKLAIDVDDDLFVEQYNFTSVKSAARATTVDAFLQAKDSGTQVPYIHMCMVDVGGACNDGGYPDNVVEWELMNNAESCSLNSTWAEKELYRIYHNDSQPTADVFKLNGKCVDGYFNVKVVYPCDVQGVAINGTQLLSQHFGFFWQGPRSLKLKIIGFDESGKAHVSNKSYDKKITMNLPQPFPVGGEKCPQ